MEIKSTPIRKNLNDTYPRTPDKREDRPCPLELKAKLQHYYHKFNVNSKEKLRKDITDPSNHKIAIKRRVIITLYLLYFKFHPVWILHFYRSI